MRTTLISMLMIFLVSEATTAEDRSCEKLASLKLPNVTITLAKMVGAGEFAPPPSGGMALPPREMFSRLPAFCRVAATLAPSSDSDIRIEVWMPASGWNGKLQGVGNGGWSGGIVYNGLAGGVMRGYAVASTDTGHSGGSGSFVLGHPEKLIDFGFRAVHEMTVATKAIITAFNGSDKADNGIINATDPNLREFLARGGKLLLYHGWNDQLISPGNTVEYYRNVEYTLGSPEDSVLLFMVPGMMHCGGGDGTADWDKTAVIERWVEKGETPDRIVASRVVNGKVVRTRPLCPYPQTAQYKGAGSTDEAENFVCRAPNTVR